MKLNWKLTIENWNRIKRMDVMSKAKWLQVNGLKNEAMANELQEPIIK